MFSSHLRSCKHHHTAPYQSEADFIEDAIPHFQNDAQVLRDTLTQGDKNANLCADKSAEITSATRSVLCAILLGH